MRPPISEVDIDELVFNSQSLVNECDSELEQVKTELGSSPSVSNAQRQLRCIGFCLNLYYGLESSVNPGDPSAYYGLPTNDLFAHYFRIGEESGQDFLDVLAGAVTRVQPMLAPEWLSGESNVALSQETTKRLLNVQSLTDQITNELKGFPISSYENKKDLGVPSNEQKKPFNFAI